nr:uncharacterized protein LOC105330088 isoform X3 [Crassostrea gigas]
MEAMALEKREELQKAKLMEIRKAMKKLEELDAIRRRKELDETLWWLAQRRDYENGWDEIKTAPMKRWDEIKTAQMKGMEERRTQNEIRRNILLGDSENAWDEIKTAPMKRMEKRRTTYEFRKMPEATKTECDATNKWIFAEQMVDPSPSFRILAIGKVSTAFRRSSFFEGTVHENERHTMQKMSDERRKKNGANNISAFAEQTNDNISDYSLKLKKGTFALCSQFLPCVGGSDLEDSHHTQQTVNGIYQHTLRKVSNCPTSVSDYIQRAKDKCSEVCTNSLQDDGCSYHCMRDSYKTSLVEFCAKPKVLFDYCPEYDPIGERIQKDIYTLCKPSNPLQIFYRSSDSLFCDQGKCLQLRDAGVSTSVTSLMTDTTPVSGDLNESWLSQYWFVVLLFGLAVILCIVLGGIFRLRGRLVAISRKYTKRGNPNNVQDENEQAALHNTA